MADRKKNKSNLSATFTNEIIASKLYHNSVELRIRGAWRDAGDSLVKCGDVYLRIKMLMEAACFYTEAAEAYTHIDKGEALLAYQKAIKVYCDIGRFDIGGKLEQKVGFLNLYAQHWEDAALHFRKAANFLSGDKLLDQSDYCLEKSAECLIRIGEYKEASQLYQILSKSCVNSNLRRMKSLDHLLMSILCLMGIPEIKQNNETKKIKTPIKQSNPNITSTTPRMTPRTEQNEEVSHDHNMPLYQTKYEMLTNLNENYENIDYLWRRSKEKLFIRNIINARIELNLHSYADHLYYFSNIREFLFNHILLLKIPMLEIKEIIAEKERIALEKKHKEEAAAAKRAKKQAKIDNPSIANSSFRSSDIDSRTSVGSDGVNSAPSKNPQNLRDSITIDNTKANTKLSIEIDDGGGRGGGRDSVNSGGGRYSIN